MSHQLDRSGAPLALLDLGRALHSLGHTVKMAALINGPLGEDFLAAGIEPAREFVGAFDLCIANTVLTSEVLPELKSLIPAVAMWVHESPTYDRYFAGLAFAHIPAAHVDRLLGVADFQIEALRDRFPDVPVGRFDACLGRDPLRPDFGPRVESGTLDICIVGSEERRKGYYRLEEISALGRPARPVSVTLVGIDPEQVAAFIAPDRLPPDVSIRATGRIPREAAMRHVAGADIYMTLSEDDVKPLGVLEALSLQKPVVATDIAAHRELRAEFPHIVCTETPLAQAWAVAAGKAVPDAGDEAAIGLGLARYRWEAFVARAADLVRLAGPPGR